VVIKPASIIAACADGRAAAAPGPSTPIASRGTRYSVDRGAHGQPRYSGRKITRQDLSAIARHLQAGEQQAVLAEALAAARRVEYDYDHVEALCAVAEHLPPSEQYPVLAEALAAPRAIEDVDSRAQALYAVAVHLPSDATELHGDLLELALGLADRDGVVATLQTLAPHWQQICRARRHEEVIELSVTLRVFAKTGRGALLNAVEALMPAIERLGGECVLRETAQAVIDTARWRP
jgi:hypothetical protein